MNITLIIIIAVILLLVIMIITMYNGFVKAGNDCEEAFSTMDVYLKKRFDLIPNLVETVKGYAAHEKETLSAVVAGQICCQQLVNNGRKAGQRKRPVRNPPFLVCSGRSISGSESQHQFPGTDGSAEEGGRGHCQLKKVLQRSCKEVQHQGSGLPYKHNCCNVPL